MSGLVSRLQERRRQRGPNETKRGVVFANAKQAGFGMGREQLRDGVEQIIKNRFPTGATSGASTIVEVHKTHSLEELDEAKERTMREAPPDFLVVVGGDGSTQKTIGEDPDFLRYLTTDPEHPTEVIVVGAGSKNVVPTALKLLGRDPLKAFDLACEKYARGIPRDTVCCPMLRINDRHGFIYGSGLVVNALDEYYRRKPGLSRAFRTGLGVIWRQTFGMLSPWRRPSVFRRFNAAISWRAPDGSEQPLSSERHNAILASSLREINPLLRVTPRAGERLGCFHGIALDNGFWRTIFNAPSMIFGASMVGAVRDAVTERLTIRYAQPMRHTIDGELYDTEQLRCTKNGVSAREENTVVIETGPYIKFVLA